MKRITAVSALILSVGCAVAATEVSLRARPMAEGQPASTTRQERVSLEESGKHESGGDESGGDESEGDESEEEEGLDLPGWVWDRLLRVYRPDPYPLDYVSRYVRRDGRGRLDCPDVDIERYRGETIRYWRTVWVHPAFRERLKRFERVAARVGEEVYGRAPDRLYQRGTWVCRVIKHRRHRFSEHALGNAIDLIGFGFPPLPRDQRASVGELGRRFRISVEEHWDADDADGLTHAVFFRRLVQELRADSVFRGMIVPPAAGHHDHLHLDMGPSRYLRGDPALPDAGVLSTLILLRLALSHDFDELLWSHLVERVSVGLDDGA